MSIARNLVFLMKQSDTFLTLSNAQISIPPQREMCFEWRQYMPSFSSLFWAKALLAVRAAGKIGGTTNVKISKELSSISFNDPWHWKKWIYEMTIFNNDWKLTISIELTPFLCHIYSEYVIPTNPIDKKTPMDLIKSRWNLKSNGGGKSIDRTSSPFVVMKPN